VTAARPEEAWPVVELGSLRRGDVVQLPTSVDGQRVIRWVGPLRLASIRRGELNGEPYLVADWHGSEGPLALTGGLYRAGARREPKTERGGRR
jgi:hypothetical protein